MNWRDVVYKKGSFRNIEFFIESVSLDGKNKVAITELPGKDFPYIEMVGRGGKQYKTDFVVIGDDYLDQKKHMITALDIQEPGELHHPYYGYMEIVVLTYSVSESFAKGGMAKFSLNFIPYNEQQFPTSKLNKQKDGIEKLKTAKMIQIEKFKKNIKVVSQSELDIFRANFKKQNEKIVTISENEKIKMVELNNLLNNPVIDAVKIGKIYFDFYQTFSSALFEKNRAVIESTMNEYHISKNSLEQSELIINAALTGIIANSYNLKFENKPEAINYTVRLSKLFKKVSSYYNENTKHYETMILENKYQFSINTYEILVNQIGKIIQHIYEKSNEYKIEKTYVTEYPIDGLSLCYMLYGTINEIDTLIRDNNILNPILIPEGKEVVYYD